MWKLKTIEKSRIIRVIFLLKKYCKIILSTGTIVNYERGFNTISIEYRSTLSGEEKNEISRLMSLCSYAFH